MRTGIILAGMILSSLIITIPLILWMAGELLHPQRLAWLIPLGLAVYWASLGLGTWPGRRTR